MAQNLIVAVYTISLTRLVECTNKMLDMKFEFQARKIFGKSNELVHLMTSFKYQASASLLFTACVRRFKNKDAHMCLILIIYSIFP